MILFVVLRVAIVVSVLPYLHLLKLVSVTGLWTYGLGVALDADCRLNVLLGDSGIDGTWRK